MGLPNRRPPATRDDVLAAARDVFEERGYAGASIPAIAARAGVPTDRVLADFSDKAELLGQVLSDGFAALNTAFEEAVQSLHGGTLDRLRAVLAAYQDVETRRARLFLITLSGAETRAAARPMTSPGDDAHLRGVMTQVLKWGQAQGDVRPDAELNAFLDTLLAVYAWSHRPAARMTGGGERMAALMDQQIALLFDSVAAAV